MEKPKKTTAKDWLDMDLKSQSGAIWTNESSKKMLKEKKYKVPKHPPMVLKPEPVTYGGKVIPVDLTILTD